MSKQAERVDFYGLLRNGDTVSVRQFILDWCHVPAEPSENGDQDRATFTSHHERRIPEVEKQLAQVKKWSITKANNEMRKEMNAALLTAKNDWEGNCKGIRATITLIRGINDWQAPSAEHEKWKCEIIKSLTNFLENNFLGSLLLPEKVLSGSAFKKEAIANLKKRLAYHERELAKDQQKNQSRAEFCQQLRDSLRRSL